jgi:hypothetical protein
MHVGAGDLHHEWQSALINDEVVLAAKFAAVGGIAAGKRAAVGGWHAGRVDTGAFPMDLVVLAHSVQHGLVQALPNAGLLPAAESPSTSHAQAAAKLLRQIFPGNTRLQYKQDASQCRAIAEPWPAALGRWRPGWQERLDEIP